jgi:hypothetical protein
MSSGATFFRSVRPITTRLGRRLSLSQRMAAGAIIIALLSAVSILSLSAQQASASPTFLISQLGADIVGEAAGDGLGFRLSLSADGSRVAVGAPLNDATGNNAGHVRVYGWNGNAWVQVGDDIGGEAAGDQSGRSVSLSADGSRVAIGAPFNDGSGDNAGHVRVYGWNGNAWLQVGADIDGEAAGDQSGRSVSLSADGSRVAIGAPFNDGSGDNAGHVRVYGWNGNAWLQVGADVDGEAAGDESGRSVSLSADGSRVAIGAPFNDGSAIDAGHVRIYRWDAALATPAWVQVGADIDGESGEDASGFSLSLSADGSWVAIGAPYNGGAGIFDAGHVRIYRWDAALATPAWVQVGADIDGEAVNDQSGISVSLSGDGSRVAIGAPLNDATGNDAGHVRVYGWNGNAWVQVGDDIGGEIVGSQSGMDVSLSSDGSRVAVGAALTGAGRARVWSIVAAITASPSLPSDPVMACSLLPPVVGASVTCTVTGGEAGIDILWRAAHNPVFAEAGVTLDATGAGEFSFVVPPEAFGQDLTVELVEWLAPVSLGVAAGPVPTSIPSGGGPGPLRPLVILGLAAALAVLLRPRAASLALHRS